MCDLNKGNQKCYPWRRKGELSSIFVPLLFPLYVLIHIWLLHSLLLLLARVRSAWSPHGLQGPAPLTPLVSSAELKLLLPLASSFLIPLIFLFLPVRCVLVFFVTVKSIVTLWVNPSTDLRECEGEDAGTPQQSA